MTLRSLVEPCNTCGSHNICHWLWRLMNLVKPNDGLTHHLPLIVTWGVILVVSCLWERELFLPHPKDRGSIPRAQQKQSLWESMMYCLKYYGHVISWRLRVIQCCSPQNIPRQYEHHTAWKEWESLVVSAHATSTFDFILLQIGDQKWSGDNLLLNRWHDSGSADQTTAGWPIQEVQRYRPELTMRCIKTTKNTQECVEKRQ